MSRRSIILAKSDINMTQIHIIMFVQYVNMSPEFIVINKLHISLYAGKSIMTKIL